MFRLIKLASTKLNYMTIGGAIIIYLDVIVCVLPSTNVVAVKIYCNSVPWLTTIGFSLCYGTIVVKMARVWYIFYNLWTTKKVCF